MISTIGEATQRSGSRRRKPTRSLPVSARRPGSAQTAWTQYDCTTAKRQRAGAGHASTTGERTAHGLRPGQFLAPQSEPSRGTKSPAQTKSGWREFDASPPQARHHRTNCNRLRYDSSRIGDPAAHRPARTTEIVRTRIWQGGGPSPDVARATPTIEKCSAWATTLGARQGSLTIDQRPPAPWRGDARSP